MRRALSIPLSLCLYAFAAAPALAAPSADLPLVACGRLACIDASGPDGSPLRLVIDTGNGNTVLSQATAARLKLAATPARGSDGAPLGDLSLTEPVALGLGEVKLAPTPLLVSKLESYNKALGTPVDGVLSYTQLKGWIAELDFRSGRFHLTQEAVVKPRSVLGAHYVKYRANAAPVLVVDGLAIHGYPIRAQLDLAFEGGLLLFPDTMEPVGLGKTQAGEPVSMATYDAGAPLDRIEPPTVAFDRTRLALPSDGAFLATAEVRPPDNDIEAVVGRQAFSGHRLVLDFIHDQVGVD